MGWFGCSRVANVPGRPTVVRNADVTVIACATAMRSWLRMILLMAPAISGVMARLTPASVVEASAGSGPAVRSSSQSRSWPTDRWEIALADLHAA